MRRMTDDTDEVGWREGWREGCSSDNTMHSHELVRVLMVRMWLRLLRGRRPLRGL